MLGQRCQTAKASDVLTRARSPSYSKIFGRDVLARGLLQDEQEGGEPAAAAAGASVNGNPQQRSIDECEEQRKRLREVLEVKAMNRGCSLFAC